MERAAEAYGIANSTAWDLVGKHEAGGLEALTPAKAGGANNQIIDTSVLQLLFAERSVLGRRLLQLILQIELHLLRRIALRRARDAFEHGSNLVLDEAHDSR